MSGHSIGDIANAATAKAMGAAGNVMNSGKAIMAGASPADIAASRGLLGVAARVRHGEANVGTAAKAAFSGNGPGGLNYGTIAGSYIGASAVGRVASGGGIYKDSNGNSNLIGVPFV